MEGAAGSPASSQGTMGRMPAPLGKGEEDPGGAVGGLDHCQGLISTVS